jgi:dTDP-4-amino-4,6-dideoxygalactose transaminase
MWTCVNAEKYASLTLNLPNHIWVSEEDVFKVIEILKKFEK